MNEVVKLIKNEDNEIIPESERVWCLVDPGIGDAKRTFCEGEVYGFGEGNANGIEKTVKRGGITCPACLAKLKNYKAVKL
ncbi:MAG: hypothetical protein AAF571_14690 [Verrucomicrobiota bacterium]